ncbi:MAG: hypothetical protein EA382_09295 [Spirochaetaceae bacterium]|nr:MAG: hypothetical protein EA382_09295 [Spirochaetaceae bacterium]
MNGRDDLPESAPGAGFRVPAATHRVMAFWSLNGDLSEEGIDRWLRDFADKGMGGAFMHPRPGLVTEYLSDRWWDLWAHALSTAKQLGLHLQIYDENSYPSGFAGGHVPSRDPNTVAGHVSLLPIASVDQIARTPAAGFITIDDSRVLPLTRDDAAARMRAGARVAAVVAARATPRAFSAGFGYVDLTLPDTTRRFLESTHDEYWKRFAADFGTTIEYAFTDEPNPAHGDGFAVNDLLLAEFADEHGYRLEESWDDLWFGDGRVRYDYFRTLNRLFLDNFVTPVDQWCRQKGIGFTGHFWEHSWPSPGKQPDNMAAMARMAVPSNDLLEFQINRPDFWPKAVLNLKELASVASQTGAKRTMVENGGAGGYDVGIGNFQRTDNTLLSFGVTGYAAHLSHYTLAGTRKYEWPQTLGEPAAWWKHYRSHGDHVARIVSLLTVSEERNTVAIVEPTRTGWLHFAPSSLAAVAPEVAAARNAASKSLDERFTSLVLDLFECGVGFDLLDEDSLANATVEGKRLVVGKRAYECVAVSTTTETLAGTTCELLSKCASAGGTVFLAGSAPLVDARPDPRGKLLATSAISVANDAELAAEVARRYPSTHIGGTVTRGGSWHRRILADGSFLYLFANSTDEPVEFSWTSEAPNVIELDTSDGTAYPVVGEGESRPTVVPAHGLAAFVATHGDPAALGFTMGDPVQRDARLRVVTGHAGVSGGIDRGDAVAPVTSIRRVDPNVVVIDYCSVGRDDEVIDDLHVSAADEQLWRWAGVGGNAWDRAIQFRRNTLERSYRRFAPRVVYRFAVADAAVDSVRCGLDLVIERAHLHRVSVNGAPLSDDAWQPWRIEDFHRAEIAHLVSAGENVVELTADRFDPLMEISPAMLLGDFAVVPDSRGFTIGAANALEGGDLNAQGMPFYPGDVEYSIDLAAATTAAAGGGGPTGGAGTLLAEIPFAGSYAEVKIAGLEPMVALESPAVLRIPVGLNEAPATMKVRVGASAQNIFGPWHSEGLALSSTWAQSPLHQPPGSAYRFVPHGLTGGVRIVAQDGPR